MGSVNPVLNSSRYVVDRAEHVSIDMNNLKELARKFSQENLIIPPWKGSTYPETKDKNTVGFFFLSDSVNFQYTDSKTGQTYATEYKGKTYEAADALDAALMRCIDNGVPILNGKFLANLTLRGIEEIFLGNPKIPMLKERLAIFRELGSVTNKKYDSDLSNVVDTSQQQRIFDNGNGVIERILSDFISFRDQSAYAGITAFFNKRAQLFVGQLQGRLLGDGVELFPKEDVEKLTVFADYEIPKLLRQRGVFRYDQKLSKKIDNGVVVKKDSKEEVEIRASTVVAGKLIQDFINEFNPARKVNALHVDAKLWFEGVNSNESKHHITITTAY